MAGLGGRRAGGAARPRARGPDPADRRARRARGDRRGRRRGVGGRRGGRRRDQARSRARARPLKAIGVGNGPAAIAVGYGGVWVANRDDGTVTRIDAATDAVSDTVRVGGSPVAVAAGLGAIWVADGGTGAVIRIDPRTRRVTPPDRGRERAVRARGRRRLGVGGGDRVARQPPRRDAAVRVRGPRAATASTRRATTGRLTPVLSLAYDGLVAYRRIPGAGGSTLVADLAASVPQPTDGGRTYTFQLRRGLRFSDGTPVRPEDFRASIERVVRLAGQVAPLLRRHRRRRRVQPAAVRPLEGHRDRRRGTDDHHPPPPARRRVQHKLAIPLAYVLPARAPATLIRGRPRRAPGPYRIAAFAPARGVAAGAQPALSLVVGRGASRRLPRRDHRRRPPRTPPRRWPPCSTAAPTPSSSPALSSGQLPVDQARALALTDASHVHTAPTPCTSYLFLNVRERAVRRPAGPPGAELRDRSPAHGRARGRQRPCGPVLPGRSRPGCPATRRPARSQPARRPRAAWSAPDLARARRLVAASGSRGARVQVWGIGGVRGASSATPAASCATWATASGSGCCPTSRSYFDYVNDTRHHVQVGFYGWLADFLTPSNFFDPFSCGHLRRNSSDNVNPSQFCDHAVDAGVRRRAGRPRHGGERALGRTRPPGAGGSSSGPAVHPPQPRCWSPTGSATRRCTRPSDRCWISSGSASRAFTALKPSRAAR